MKKILCSAMLTFSFSIFCLGQAVKPDPDCNKDVKDQRGKMKPWNKGTHETGKYRNLFLEAGYQQANINAKLAKAYHDVFEGPDRIYFEVGDSMAYVSDLKTIPESITTPKPAGFWMLCGAKTAPKA